MIKKHRTKNICHGLKITQRVYPLPDIRAVSLSINLKFYFCGVHAASFVFPLTCAAEKHIISEKPLNKRFFKGTGVVLAGIECSPKIFDFRASGIPVQERVDFFDTLTARISVTGYTRCVMHDIFFQKAHPHGRYSPKGKATRKDTPAPWRYDNHRSRRFWA